MPDPLTPEALAEIRDRFEIYEDKPLYLHAADCPSYCDAPCNGNQREDVVNVVAALLAEVERLTKRVCSTHQIVEPNANGCIPCAIVSAWDRKFCAAMDEADAREDRITKERDRGDTAEIVALLRRALAALQPEPLGPPDPRGGSRESA